MLLFSVVPSMAGIYGGVGNVSETALEAYNKKCLTDFTESDIDEVYQVDSGHDFAIYTVFFKNEGSVSVSRSFMGGKNTVFHADEVYCN